MLTEFCSVMSSIWPRISSEASGLYQITIWPCSWLCTKLSGAIGSSLKPESAMASGGQWLPVVGGLASYCTGVPRSTCWLPSDSKVSRSVQFASDAATPTLSAGSSGWNTMSSTTAIATAAAIPIVIMFARRSSHDRGAVSRRLSHHHLRGAGELVSYADPRGREIASLGVAGSPIVDEGFEPGDADRDVRLTNPPGPAEGVADDDRALNPQEVLELGAQPPGREIRVQGKQNDVVILDVAGIYARIGADEPVPRLGDDHLFLAAEHQ